MFLTIAHALMDDDVMERPVTRRGLAALAAPAGRLARWACRNLKWSYVYTVCVYQHEGLSLVLSSQLRLSGSLPTFSSESQARATRY